MSMIGVRDMSVLEEAPYERRPIQTYVMEMNWEMVREAINRELARDGQVYYVYNRVKDIDQDYGTDSKACARCKCCLCTMVKCQSVKLEQIMMDFVNGDIDVLVSTTIIETGLNIPNVNTIIIHDSDRYGTCTAVSAKRTCRPFKPHCLCFYHVSAKQDFKRRG